VNSPLTSHTQERIYAVSVVDNDEARSPFSRSTLRRTLTTFVVWGLYGVAAALADVPKNVMYNAIDVVSKNGFGLFIFVYALTV
jgi:hypothetical protein